jgi:hypothetical protein
MPYDERFLMIKNVSKIYERLKIQRRVLTYKKILKTL